MSVRPTRSRYVFQPLFQLLFGKLLDLHPKGHILPHCSPRHAGGLLEYERDVVLFRVGLFPVDVDVAVRSRDELGQAVEERRFPASRGPNDAEKLSLGHVKRNFVQNRQIAKAFGEILDLDFYLSVVRIIPCTAHCLLSSCCCPGMGWESSILRAFALDPRLPSRWSSARSTGHSEPHGC